MIVKQFVKAMIPSLNYYKSSTLHQVNSNYWHIPLIVNNLFVS